MSTGQLLLTMLVAMLVFGPSKLPMLAKHLALIINRLNQHKQHLMNFWQHQLNEQQLQENNKKAADADVTYQQDRT